MSARAGRRIGDSVAPGSVTVNCPEWLIRGRHPLARSADAAVASTRDPRSGNSSTRPAMSDPHQPPRPSPTTAPNSCPPTSRTACSDCGALGPVPDRHVDGQRLRGLDPADGVEGFAGCRSRWAATSRSTASACRTPSLVRFVEQRYDFASAELTPRSTTHRGATARIEVIQFCSHALPRSCSRRSGSPSTAQPT